MERKIEAPDKVWLTRRQAAAWLNIGPSSFDQLVESFGLEAIDCGPRTKRYHWMTVVALAHLQAISRKTGPAPRSSNKPV